MIAALVVVAGAAAALIVPRTVGDRSHPGSGTYTATAPWRLRVDATGYGDGCTVTVTDQASGDDVALPGNLYSVARFQVPAGSYRWRSNDDRCLVTPFAGAGTATLPLLQSTDGDTDAITSPPPAISVEIVDSKNSDCGIRLFDATTGQALDSHEWKRGDAATFDLSTDARPAVYVSDDNCVLRLTG